MVRGIERRSIFLDDEDREELVRRLSILIPELDFRCFAWALLPNHFHLVVQSGRTRVSRLMARLGTGYARYFNERHGRVGHLFQNRFRSRRVVDDADLTGLVLYVCRNPLEAGLGAVAAPDAFRWCSISALSGRRAPFAFESVAETLALFGADPKRARARLRERLEIPASAERPAKAVAPPKGPASRAAPADLASVVEAVCAAASVCEADLRSKRRTRRIAYARSELVLRASRDLGLSGSELARWLGITPSGVSRMLDRAQGAPLGKRVN